MKNNYPVFNSSIFHTVEARSKQGTNSTGTSLVLYEPVSALRLWSANCSTFKCFGFFLSVVVISSQSNSPVAYRWQRLGSHNSSPGLPWSGQIQVVMKLRRMRKIRKIFTRIPITPLSINTSPSSHMHRNLLFIQKQVRQDWSMLMEMRMSACRLGRNIDRRNGS